MKAFKNNTFTVVTAALLIGAAAILGGAYINNRFNGEKLAASQPNYSLSLNSGQEYSISDPNTLSFKINANGEPLRDYDRVHEKIMHVIVVRKDRTNFQHIHPDFDSNSGEFTLNNFKLPTDGDYRVFADFTATASSKASDGVKPPTTLFKDVSVGDVSKYTPTSITENKTKSSADGLDTAVFEGGNDGGGSGYTAGTTNSIAIAIEQNGQPYKQLERYLGALGHMVVLGPDLEFVHAHAQSEDVANQSGVISFGVDFPKAGIYTAFLQTQANGKVSTFDYVLTAKDMPKPSDSNQPSPNPDHGGGH